MFLGMLALPGPYAAETAGNAIFVFCVKLFRFTGRRYISQTGECWKNAWGKCAEKHGDWENAVEQNTQKRREDGKSRLKADLLSAIIKILVSEQSGKVGNHVQRW